MSLLEFWLVVTVFQGLFDDVMPFKTELEADTFAEKVKADFANEDIQVVKKRIGI